MMKATSFGGAGVHVFILCSGFGLYLSYLNRPLGYKDFLKRRFGRVYWPMAVICLCTACWMLYQGKEILMPLLGNLFLFKMFVPDLETSMGGQMWFISTIIQFYLAWPLILKLINIKWGGVLDSFGYQSVMVHYSCLVRVWRGTGVEQFLFTIFVGVLPGDEVGGNIYKTSVGFECSKMEMAASCLFDRFGSDWYYGLGRLPLAAL